MLSVETAGNERMEWTRDAGQLDVPADLGPGCFRKERLGNYWRTNTWVLHLLRDPTLPHTFSRARSMRTVTPG